MVTPGLIWRTVRHLRARQLLYQVIHRLRPSPTLPRLVPVPPGHWLAVPEASKAVSYDAGRFTFLNQSVTLQPINWNYAGAGKLWTYNLNYFDFLNQPDLPVGEGLELIGDFIDRTTHLRDGLEPYPTSLRIVNWVQFLSRHRIRSARIDAHLFAQIWLLNRRLEYHLAGNHLLENGLALLMGALYFQHFRWLRRGVMLVRVELRRQVLADGGHDERSPMYHQLLLDRLLDLLLTIQSSSWYDDELFVDFLAGQTSRMLDWLSAVTFANGKVPMVNDSALGIAPSLTALRKKARGLGLPAATVKLGESGYRLFRQPRYELFADVGPVGVDHQPGHAHADTLSFLLNVDNRPTLVDNGTSTYEIGGRRQWERSTGAHNTVTVRGQDSSEVWAGFRMGRRARVTLLRDTATHLRARHDGYRHLGTYHEREWELALDRIIVRDRLTGAESIGIARFYVHPSVTLVTSAENVQAGPVLLSFGPEPPVSIRVADYEMAMGFNRRLPGRCLEVTFCSLLETQITLGEPAAETSPRPTYQTSNASG